MDTLNNKTYLIINKINNIMVIFFKGISMIFFMKTIEIDGYKISLGMLVVVSIFC